MPVYNRADIVDSALSSIAAQTLNAFETLVVDDGSTDGSVAVAETRSFVKVIRQDNLGPGSARNLGVQNASGTYIAFLDSDDLWFPWTLQHYAFAIEKFDFPAFLTGNPFLFRDQSDLRRACDGHPRYRVFTDYFATTDQWLWHGVSSFVIRRDVLLSVGGFAEGRINGEDAELAMRLGTAKGFVHIANPPMLGYRVHQGNVTLDAEKSRVGLELLLEGERCGRFPGGSERATQRANIISRHVRPFAVDRARGGDATVALHLYAAVFMEAVRNCRLRFLFGLPLLALTGWFKRWFSQFRAARQGPC